MNYKILTLASIAILMFGCASKKETTVPNTVTISAPTPKAIAYKMSGQVSALNVPINVDDRGNIINFPDPKDLRDAEPIALKNGYLLDRRGVNANTRFLRYTYEEYSSLNTPPSLSELKAAIIPDARIAEIVRLPMTVDQAIADLNAVNAMLP